MLKVFDNSLQQLLQFMQMGQHSLLQLSLIAGWGVRVYPLFDITVQKIFPFLYTINYLSPSICSLIAGLIIGGSLVETLLDPLKEAVVTTTALNAPISKVLAVTLYCKVR